MPMELSDLTADDLAATLAHQSAKSAAGMDGWRVAELKRLPPFLLSKLADLLNVVERSGQWPSSLERALITLIPKGEGGDPLAMRPISVASAVYRLWAATRLRDAIKWQEGWVHPGQHGFRPNHGTMDVYWELAVRVEEALVLGQPLTGLMLDYAKCFDRLPHGVMLALGDASGAHPRLMGPLRQMYAGLRRRFKVGGGVGKEFRATNGILQGCPLSVILLNLMVSVWAKAIDAETDADPMAYADDTTVVGPRSEVERAGAVTAEYCSLTGQQLNVKKSLVFHVNAEVAETPLCLQGEVVKVVEADRCLGADVRFTPAAQVSAHVVSRVQKSVAEADRIAALPLPLEVRCTLLATQPSAVAFYGVEVTQLTPTHIATLEAAALRVIWGGRQPNRCKEILLTVLARGHLVDPHQAVPYRRLVGLVRMLQRRSELRDLVQRLLQQYLPGRGLGPVHLAMDALRALGWTWSSPWRVTRQGHTTDLLLVDPSLWAHDVRAALRMMLWDNASARRADMRGLADGIDRDATNAAWRSLGGIVAGVIRGIIAGAVWTQDRRFRSGRFREDTPVCPHCSTGATEDLHHLWWDCSAWAQIRSAHPGVMAEDRQSWPPCFVLCGVMVHSIDRDAQRRLYLAQSVQRLMAEILLLHDSVARLAIPDITSGDSLQPPVDFLCRWDPPGARTCYAPALLGLVPPPRWRHGRAMFFAFTDYLRQLQWPQGQPTHGVTFVELAIDFEIVAGMNLPAAPRRGGGRVVPPVADRAHAVAAMLKTLASYVAPTIIHGGSRSPSIRSLQLLGLPPSFGLTARSVLLGGTATEDVLRQLARVPRQPSVGHPRARQGHPAWDRAWSQQFTPLYPSSRADRSEEWHRRAADELQPAIVVVGVQDAAQPQSHSSADLRVGGAPRGHWSNEVRVRASWSLRGRGLPRGCSDGSEIAPCRRHGHGVARLGGLLQTRARVFTSWRTHGPGRGRGHVALAAKAPVVASGRAGDAVPGGPSPVSPRERAAPQPGNKRLAGLGSGWAWPPPSKRPGARCGDKRLALQQEAPRSSAVTREEPRPLKRVRHGRGVPEAREI